MTKKEYETDLIKAKDFDCTNKWGEWKRPPTKNEPFAFDWIKHKGFFEPVEARIDPSGIFHPISERSIVEIMFAMRNNTEIPVVFKEITNSQNLAFEVYPRMYFPFKYWETERGVLIYDMLNLIDTTWTGKADEEITKIIKSAGYPIGLSREAKILKGFTTQDIDYLRTNPGSRMKSKIQSQKRIETLTSIPLRDIQNEIKTAETQNRKTLTATQISMIPQIIKKKPNLSLTQAVQEAQIYSTHYYTCEEKEWLWVNKMTTAKGLKNTNDLLRKLIQFGMANETDFIKF